MKAVVRVQILREIRYFGVLLPGNAVVFAMLATFAYFQMPQDVSVLTQACMTVISALVLVSASAVSTPWYLPCGIPDFIATRAISNTELSSAKLIAVAFGTFAALILITPIALCCAVLTGPGE